MSRSLRKLISLQFKEFYREPEVLFWALIFPILLAWLLGISFKGSGTQPHHVGIIPPVSPELSARIEQLKNPQGDRPPFRFQRIDAPAAALGLKRGEISLYIRENPADLSLEFSFDPANVTARLDSLLLEKEFIRKESASGVRFIPLTIQGTRYIDFLIPGLLAMGIMNSALWGIGWSLVELRIKKLLRIMAASPMDKRTFLLSRFTTRLILSGVEFLLIYLFARFYFQLPIQGSLVALLLIFASGNLAFAGIAFLLASRTQSNQVASGLINAVNMPMMLLSGIFFSYRNFPGWSQPLIRLLPLTRLTDSLRAIFNEGAGVAAVLPSFLVLTALGFLFFFIGLRLFKWY